MRTPCQRTSVAHSTRPRLPAPWSPQRNLRLAVSQVWRVRPARPNSTSRSTASRMKLRPSECSKLKSRQAQSKSDRLYDTPSTVPLASCTVCGTLYLRWSHPALIHKAPRWLSRTRRPMRALNCGMVKAAGLRWTLGSNGAGMSVARMSWRVKSMPGPTNRMSEAPYWAR